MDVKLSNLFGMKVLGIVENMSCFKCPHCQEKTYVFGHGGAHKTAVEMGIEFLGEVCSVICDI